MQYSDLKSEITVNKTVIILSNTLLNVIYRKKTGQNRDAEKFINKPKTNKFYTYQ